MKLTEAARGRDCAIRLPGCSNDPATVVAAHYRSVSLGAGMGIKPNDWLSAHACNMCHDLCDSRRRDPNLTRTEIRHAHLEGVIRTIQRLIDLGLITVKE